MRGLIIEPRNLGRRKHLKLGGHDTLKGTFHLENKGAFSTNKRTLRCLLQDLGRHVPPVPPGSYVYARNQWMHRCFL